MSPVFFAPLGQYHTARVIQSSPTSANRKASVIGIMMDALVLMVLLKTKDHDVGFGTSFFVALVASIGTTVLAINLAALMGTAGIAIAVIISAMLLGVALSALFGLEIKRSFLIGAIFMVAHIGVGFGIQLILNS